MGARRSAAAGGGKLLASTRRSSQNQLSRTLWTNRRMPAGSARISTVHAMGVASSRPNSTAAPRHRSSEAVNRADAASDGNVLVASRVTMSARLAKYAQYVHQRTVMRACEMAASVIAQNNEPNSASAGPACRRWPYGLQSCRPAHSATPRAPRQAAAHSGVATCEIPGPWSLRTSLRDRKTRKVWSSNFGATVTGSSSSGVRMDACQRSSDGSFPYAADEHSTHARQFTPPRVQRTPHSSLS